MSLREAAEKVLEAIEYGAHGDPHMARGRIKRAVEALRAALAEANPMRCEPCGIRFADKQPGSLCPRCYREVTKAESAGAEPVAPRPIDIDDRGPVFALPHPPAREAESVVNQQLTTELSDEECDKAIRESGLWSLACERPQNLALLRGLCRAVLAAARGKG